MSQSIAIPCFSRLWYDVGATRPVAVAELLSAEFAFLEEYVLSLWLLEREKRESPGVTGEQEKAKLVYEQKHDTRRNMR